jgi:hypothetical protein
MKKGDLRFVPKIFPRDAVGSQSDEFVRYYEMIKRVTAHDPVTVRRFMRTIRVDSLYLTVDVVVVRRLVS